MLLGLLVFYSVSMGKYTRLGKNIFWMFIGNMGSKMLTFLMLPFYTSHLSVGDYGTVDLIQVYVTLLTGLVTCCLTEAIFVFPKDQSISKQTTYFTSGIIFSLSTLVLTGIFFSFLVVVLHRLSYDGIFVKYNAYIFLIICVTFLQSYTQQFIRSIDKIKVYVSSGIVLTLATALTSLVFLPLWGVDGYIYSLILSYLAATVYTIVIGKEYIYFSLKCLSKQSLNEMLRYSIPMIPNSIMWWILSTLNRPLLEYYSGIDAVGILAVANKFPMVMSVIYSVFAYSWQISVLEEFKGADYKDFYNRVFRLFFFVLIAFLLVITLLGRPLIKLMAESSYYDAWQYISVLSLAVVFSNISGFIGTNFIATKESKHYFSTSIWGGVSCLILNFLLIPICNIWGAVISILLSNLLMLLLRVKITWKYAPIYNSHLYLLMLLMLIGYIAINQIEDNFYLNFLCALILFGGILFLNRRFFGEILSVCKNTIKNKIGAFNE